MNPVRNNLVALGSAAVLSVYAAGYFRTRAAAERFAGADLERREAVPTMEHRPDTLPPMVRVDTVAARPEAATTRAAPPAAAASATREPAKADPAVTSAGHDSAPPAGAPSAPAAGHPATPTAMARALDSAPPPHTVAPAALPPAAAPGLQGTASGASLGDTTTTAAAPHGQYKDGLYTGWGTSRHGDIQATVEVRDGRIVSATISQCLTRYSCSWVSALPGQVVSRQSANVDYVSGATQSSNAFYYAVVEALAKAK